MQHKNTEKLIRELEALYALLGNLIHGIKNENEITGYFADHISHIIFKYVASGDFELDLKGKDENKV